MKKIKQNAALLKLNCIKAFCYDGTKALAIGKGEDRQGNIIFLFGVLVVAVFSEEDQDFYSNLKTLL